MATWHQQRNPVQLWHETQWTVVEDCGHTCVSRWDTAEQAEAHRNRISGGKQVPGIYVLAPMQAHMRKK